MHSIIIFSFGLELYAFDKEEYTTQSRSTMDVLMNGKNNQCSLKWNNYEENLLSVFDQLLQQEALVDVTLATEGKSLRCHKVVLSACSSYFKSILSDTDQTQHPIVILRDVSYAELKFIVQYMYKGEMNVSQEELPSILKIAEDLQLHGLVDFESKGSASGVSLINKKDNEEVKQAPTQCSGEEVRQKRKRHLVQCDENFLNSTLDSKSRVNLESKLMGRTTPYHMSSSPSSSCSGSSSKNTLANNNLEHNDRHSGSESSTPKPPSLLHKPPPPPTNSPMSIFNEGHITPPKLKENRLGVLPHSPSLPLPPSSLASPSTSSGVSGNPTNNILPNLSHLQNQHQKMFQNLPSSIHNGFMGSSASKRPHFDDMSDVKPSILEMIQEERRVNN